MKKSKIVNLVLITAALASCNKKSESTDWDDKGQKKVYMRSDSTATYTRTHHHGIGSGLLWYYAFRPYGSYNSGAGYRRTGFYSGNLHSKSNVGTSAAKSHIVRGGFGGFSSRAAS